MNGYTWIGNKRNFISNKAWRESGGVGFRIKNSIFEYFEVHILDKSRDDILWIYLKSVNDPNLVLDFSVCYLQPERSSRGNISQEFYEHLLSQLYLYNTGNPIFICCDFNGRIGDSQDFNDSLDNLPKRQYVDEQKNMFGEHLLDFLSDANCFMLNGRGDPSKDNFTYVSTKGKFVVDYMIIPYSDSDKYNNFEVKLISDLLIDYDIDVYSDSRVPDHSVLTCTFKYCEYENNSELQTVSENQSPVSSGNKKHFRKYNVSNIPSDIFGSERCVRNLEKVSDSLLNIRIIENRISTIYNTLINVLHEEMDDKTDYKDLTQNRSTRKRSKARPYWNDNVHNQLADVNKAETFFFF